MNIEGKTAVVTGAGGGIGRALALRFHAEGAAHVACVDRDEAAAQRVANEIGGSHFGADMSEAGAIEGVIDAVEAEQGPIDLFCGNAGIMTRGGVEVPDADWQRMWDVNVMAHVRAARHLIPRMTERGGGYFLLTASAAGLLNQVGAASYGVTKHAAIGLAEWIALTHGDAGIKVSVLCPQAVRTDMVRGNEEGVASQDGLLEPEAVAEECVRGIASESFLILPHSEVLGYMRNKTADYDRWIGGMRKLNRRFNAD